MDRECFNLVMVEIGWKENNKAMFKYMIGKSPNIQLFLDAVKKTSIPKEDRLAVALKLTDNLVNGRSPSWLRDVYSDNLEEWGYFPGCSGWRNYLINNPHKLFIAYCHMNKDNIEKWKKAIATIDQCTLGQTVDVYV
jgi:hypothetical protein